jgi:hypothetical protein
MTPKAAARVTKVLKRTQTDIERQRAEEVRRRSQITGALDVLRGEPTKKAARRAVRTLARHRAALQIGDRLALRTEIIPALASAEKPPTYLMALGKLAERPRTVRERLAEAGRTAMTRATEAVVARVTGEPAGRPAELPALAAEPAARIEGALATLESLPEDRPGMHARDALRTLNREAGALKTSHHRRLGHGHGAR